MGLGNPGPRYSATRHNVGFMVVDQLAQTVDAKFARKSDCLISCFTLETGENVIVAKPQTYMNRSGKSVLSLIGKYRIPLYNLLVILDDFNLPFGKLRFRSRGSSGGHNGLASVIECINEREFPRLRIGIGREIDFEPADFVLGRFYKDEKKLLTETLQQAGEGCIEFVNNGIVKAMNKYNQDKI